MLRPPGDLGASVGEYLTLLGAGCVIVVILTHVCERFHLLPWMGWGLEHSAGHYLDLYAAVLAIGSLPAGLLLWATAKRRGT